MFDGLKAAIQRKAISGAIRFASKRCRSYPLETKKCWNNVQNCLILWPRSGVDIRTGEPVYNRLRERFPSAMLTTLMLSSTVAAPAEMDDLTVKVNQQEFNFLGLPRRSLRDRIARIKADFVVDLSPQYDPLTAYFCLLSNAPIKVSFASAKSDLVFNYQIAPHPDRSRTERYKVMARYIG